MPKGKPIDRNSLHNQLWDARDRHNRVKIHQRKFAKFLGITHTHMCRIIGDFEEEGRIRKIAAREKNVGVYLITDPAEYHSTGLTHPNG